VAPLALVKHVVAENSELNPYLTDHFKLDCQTSVHLWSVA
jgi:hypothetical protein